MATSEGLILGRNATLVCLGDSITQNTEGYVRIVGNMLTAGYPERNIKVVNAGIGGHKAPDMLARLQSDVIAHGPQCVTINVGVNDVWHGFHDFENNCDIPGGGGPNGVPIDVYEQTLARIVDTLRETTDAEIVLLTPTVIGEDVDNEDNRQNELIGQYADAMKRVSYLRHTRLAHTHHDFVRAIRAGKSASPDFKLTTDGVHHNEVGSYVMALTVLATLGFSFQVGR